MATIALIALALVLVAAIPLLVSSVRRRRLWRSYGPLYEDDDPGNPAGVREPRRPRPPGDSGTAVAGIDRREPETGIEPVA